MRRNDTFRRVLAGVCVAVSIGSLTGLAGRCAAQLAVQSTSPAMNAHNVARTTPVSITFDRPLDPASVISANVQVFGKVTGPITTLPVLSNANRTITITHTRPLAAGELVMVVLSRNLRAADGTFLRSTGYSYEFMTGTARSYGRFRQKTIISNRDQTGAQTRIYGGLACDLNRDGWADMTTINEVSADMRVFLNDGAGNYGPMITPYTPIPFEASPNEVADFDRDGFIDVVTSSDGTDQVAICFGNGAGGFATPILVNVGENPRGFGILDVDGDGDLDITVANANSDTISLIRSNGNRTFQPVQNIPLAGGPYGMVAAEMNNDGLLDLVVGCRNTQQAKVLRNNGNGTFTQVESRSIGGNNWVIVCGDLNGDGNMDLSAANSGSANGSVMLGTGTGTLGAAAVQSVGGAAVSTDLVDLEGDGDLDWVISSFGAGAWFFYINNGAGVFTPLPAWPAPANPSCAVPTDFDNDGDVDLVLTDEIADVLVVLENTCASLDFNNDGIEQDPTDIEALLSVYSGGPCVPASATCSGIDINNDGIEQDPTDIEAFLSLYSGGPCI